MRPRAPRSTKETILISGLLFLFILAMVPGLDGFVYDMQFFRNWSEYTGQYGLRNAYRTNTDYLPIFQYCLWLFAKIAGTPENIGHYIGYIRIVPLLCEYLALYIVYQWIDRRVDYLFLLLCSILNVAFSYDTVLWGQVDAIYTALVLLSFYLIFRGKPVLSSIFMLVALNTKLQAIVFVPMWGLMLFTQLHREHKWKHLLYVLPAMVLTEAAILFPFTLGTIPLSRIWDVVTNSVGIIPYVTANACNMWYLILEQEDGITDDVMTGSGLSYFDIGMLAFCAASFIALWPLLKHTVLVLAGKRKRAVSREVIWLSAALIAMIFYYFCTQMHERYIHPAFIFLTAYAFCKNRYGLYLLFSFTYLLSLDRVLYWLRLKDFRKWMGDGDTLAILFGCCIVWALILLYRQAYIENKEAQHAAKEPVLVPTISN